MDRVVKRDTRSIFRSFSILKNGAIYPFTASVVAPIRKGEPELISGAHMLIRKKTATKGGTMEMSDGSAAREPIPGKRYFAIIPQSAAI